MPGTFERDLVLYELQRLNERIDIMDERNRDDHNRVVEQLGTIEKDLVHLKVRASAWGVIGGAVATAVAYVANSIGWPTGHA